MDVVSMVGSERIMVVLIQLELDAEQSNTNPWVFEAEIVLPEVVALSFNESIFVPDKLVDESQRKRYESPNVLLMDVSWMFRVMSEILAEAKRKKIFVRFFTALIRRELTLQKGEDKNERERERERERRRERERKKERERHT
jgi:hypothetical protein